MIENQALAYFQQYDHRNELPRSTADLITGILRLDHASRGATLECPVRPHEPDYHNKRRHWLHSLCGGPQDRYALCPRKLFWCLRELDTFSTQRVMDCFDVGERHARRYVKALDLLMQQFQRYPHVLQ